MDRVAVAQLIFSGTSTEASVLSIFSAHVTDTWVLHVRLGLMPSVILRDGSGFHRRPLAPEDA